MYNNYNNDIKDPNRLLEEIHGSTESMCVRNISVYRLEAAVTVLACDNRLLACDRQ